MTTTTLLSLSDINTTVNHEPRILDVRLAEALGFKRPRDIRKVIERHIAALDKLGTRATVARVVNGGNATEYYLTKKQAIYITAKSETENAVDLTIHVIEVFDAAMNGVAHPALPKTTIVRSHERKLPEKPDLLSGRTEQNLKIALDRAEMIIAVLNALNYVNYPDAIGRLVCPHLAGASCYANTMVNELRQMQCDLAARMPSQQHKLLGNRQLFAHTN